MTEYKNMCFDEERALYGIHNALVKDCKFEGPADGESALKETGDITVKGCSFSLRYPLWHTHGFLLEDSTMDELTRAALWYSSDGHIKNCRLDGIKCLRECKGITIENSSAHSPELGWKCRDIAIVNSEMESEYFLFEAENVKADGLKMKGKYSFQYTKDIVIENSELDTKDAFWHSENVTVKNSVVKGEYLGWYSKGLTLINCKIIGTQPLCYCEELRLVDCTMEGTDLSFEYSDVKAEVTGDILSVKNPKSGSIVADSIGEIISENAVVKTECEIKIRQQR